MVSDRVRPFIRAKQTIPDTVITTDLHVHHDLLYAGNSYPHTQSDNVPLIGYLQ